MRIAILAQFPIHILPEFSHLGEPKQHYATWLPQLAQGFGSAVALEHGRLKMGDEESFESTANHSLHATHNSPPDPESLIQNPPPSTPFPIQFSRRGDPSAIRHSLSIHWITLSTEVSEPRTAEYLHQTFHILPTAPSGRASSLFREDRRQIQQTINCINPDLVHGWGNEDVYGLAAVLSGRRNIVSVQGLLSYYVLRNRLPSRTYLQALIELFVLNRADQLVCESRWSCDMVRRRLLNRSKPINHVEYGVQKLFYNVKWHPDPAKPVAVFTGAAEPRKGIQDVVRAFQSPGLRDAELWVLGADKTPYAQALKKTSPPNVKWFGRLGLEESIAYLSKGWCFVLPTRGDTGPMAVKESMVVGLPVISSPCSGARDYIHDGENGFIVPCGQPGILAERLERLLKNYETCRAMGASRHEEAREHFRSERTADKFMRIYRCGIQK